MWKRLLLPLWLLLLLVFQVVAAAADHSQADIHAFFYLWYGNASRGYMHWDHAVIPHWNEVKREQYARGPGHFAPPSHIAAPFYPLAGLYSSDDDAVLDAQLQALSKAQVASAVLSWWGPQSGGDGEGVETYAHVQAVFRVAEESMKDMTAAGNGEHEKGHLSVRTRLSFHLEPFPGMTADQVAANIISILGEWGSSPALYRYRTKLDSGDGKPLFFVYDAYHVPATEWAHVLPELRKHACVIGLLVEQKHRDFILEAGFDGFYTYFAADGFSYGATMHNWPSLSTFAAQHDLLFFPSVGPGYDDTFIRPWNAHNTRRRQGGHYYNSMWASAIQSKPSGGITITSFNEWGEGTQIEGAACAPPETRQHLAGTKSFKLDAGYEIYTTSDGGGAPEACADDVYLAMTRAWGEAFKGIVLADERQQHRPRHDEL